MHRVHPARTDRHRQVVHCLYPQPLEPFHPAHDVEDGVHRPHFVQVDLRRRHAVDPSLGLAHQLERTNGARLDRLGARRAANYLDQLTDVAPVRPRTPAWVLRDLERDLRGGDRGADDLPDPDADVGESQPLRQRLEPSGLQPGVHQGAKQHVPADPCDGVQNSDPHVASVVS